MDYTDDNRGVIQYPDRKRQLINFRNVRYDNITPTDVDAYLELRNELFLFYEFKYKFVSMPDGQMKADTHLVDALAKAGKQAVLMLCRHFEEDTTKDIDAATAIVVSYYYNGQWYKNINKTMKCVTDEFIGFAAPGKIPDKDISRWLKNKEDCS